MANKILEDIEMTDDAFWSKIADVCPEVEWGDWIPEDALALQKVCEDAVAEFMSRIELAAFFASINFLAIISNN